MSTERFYRRSEQLHIAVRLPDGTGMYLIWTNQHLADNTEPYGPEMDQGRRVKTVLLGIDQPELEWNLLSHEVGIDTQYTMVKAENTFEAHIGDATFTSINALYTHFHPESDPDALDVPEEV